MDRGGIDSGGDVHEFEAERAAGKREIADVAHESDVGIVDRDVEIGLIVEAGGLVGAGGARGFFFLHGFVLRCEDMLPTARGIKESSSGKQWNMVRSGSSYCSHSDLALTFGLGADAAATVDVAWPSGAKQQFKNVAANQRVLIDESRGLSSLH